MRENSNSKTLFYKDCSLERERERERERENYKNILTNNGKRQNNDYLRETGTETEIQRQRHTQSEGIFLHSLL